MDEKINIFEPHLVDFAGLVAGTPELGERGAWAGLAHVCGGGNIFPGFSSCYLPTSSLAYLLIYFLAYWLPISICRFSIFRSIKTLLDGSVAVELQGVHGC